MCIGWLVCTSQKGGQRIGKTGGGSTSKHHAVVDENGLSLVVVQSEGMDDNQNRRKNEFMVI